MTGLTTLAPLSGYAFGGAGSVSADGSTPVGASVGFGGSLAFAQATRWTSGGTALGLGFLPGGNDSVATGVNANGSVIAGYSNSATSLPGAQEAFRWTTPAGMTGLGFLPGDTRSQAAGVNADGSVVVGISVGGSNPETARAFRWTAMSGMAPIGFLPGHNNSQAFAVSNDGSVVVGSSFNVSSLSVTALQAFRWTAATGPVGLGFIPGTVAGQAFAVSGDGKVVAGETCSTVGCSFATSHATRWTDAVGAQSVRDTLAANGEDLTGWHLATARGLSADGSVIVGNGTDPSGNSQAWIARIPLNAFAFLDLAGVDHAIGSLVWGGTVTNSGPGPARMTAGDDNADTTFKGTIQDGSSTTAFTKAGTGTLILTGAHTYTGGTTISGGTLQLGNGGASGSIVGNVVDNSVLAFNRSDAVTFGGVISGIGAVQQNGTGSTNLTATSSYTGATTVNAGLLSVNGSIASSSGVTVNAGATLGGNGALPRTTINGGTLSPGNSIGTISVGGSLTFVGAGNYVVEVSPAAADRTNVSGTASLAGTLRAIGTGGTYTVGARYTVLNATGGVSGSFGTLDITGSFGATRPHIEYDANNVFLVLDPNALPLNGLTRNERAVAGAVNTFLQAGNPAPPVFASLFGLTAAQLPAALDALSGEVHASTAGVLMDESRYIRTAVLGRLRQASYGGDSSMASLSLGGPQLAMQDEAASALAYAKSPIVTKAPPMTAPSVNRDMVFWAQGSGAWGNFNSDGNAAAVKRDLAGFVTGFDARFGEGWRMGLAAGYTGARIVTNGRGSANVDTGHVAVYGGFNVGAFNVRAGGAYALHTIDTDRTIAFAGFGDRAMARYDGGTGQIFGEVGYALSFGKVAVEPFAGAAWVRLQTDAAAERGGPAALTIAAGTFEAGYATLGIRAASMVPLENGMVLIPRASAAWQHAFNDVTPAATLAFQSTGTTFVVAGVPIARDSLLAEAGLDLAISRNATLGVSYLGQIASNVTDHTARGKFSWRF